MSSNIAIARNLRRCNSPCMPKTLTCVWICAIARIRRA